MGGRVIVVGSVNVDLVVRSARLPGPGETVTGGTFRRHHGGKGGNQAVAAARLGAATVMVGAVGDDDLGGEARAALERDGVDTSLLGVVAGTPTGVALIVVDDAGENLIAVASGANAQLDVGALRSALERLAPGPGDVVLAGHEIPTPVTRAALHAGRAAGATTILNPAPAEGLDRATLGLADVITPNRGELAALVAGEARRTGRRGGAPSAPEAAARSLLEPSAEGAGPDAVLVSLGSRGALLVRPSGSLELPAPGLEAVDATGAGDALNGGLAAGLADGLDLAVAARRAVLAASLSTRIPGAREGLVTGAELAAAEAQWPPTSAAQPEKR